MISREGNNVENRGGAWRRPCLLSLLGLFFLEILSFARTPASAASSAVPIINERGSMKEVYVDGGAPKVNLNDLKDTPHLYALGPLSKLRGEILIWDSRPFECRANMGNVQVKTDWDETAAFLAWSSVSKWKKIKVPPAVRSLPTFNSWLNSMSGSSGGGAPLPARYPFLLKGHFGRIVWHISSVKDDGTPLTPERQQTQQFHGQNKILHAEMLGFYSPDDQGIFIPQGSSTHIHVNIAERVIGHVDDFDPIGESSLTLYVPD
jgi:hypothetical protein